jgi:hypothetical protein
MMNNQPLVQRSPPRAITGRTAQGTAQTVATVTSADGELVMRPATQADTPWIMSWSTEIGLPATQSRRARSFILLKDGQRIGYGATRLDNLPGPNGPEPVVWIISVFIVPHMRGKGLVPRFAEIATRQYYNAGRFGARVARTNYRMRKFMEETGWTKAQETQGWIDYTFSLAGPWSRNPDHKSSGR